MPPPLASDRSHAYAADIARRASTHVDSAAAVGRRLAAAREHAGVSQRALAFPGCTAAYISRVEAGQRIPSYQILMELGRRLGVSAGYLATGTEAGDAVDTADTFLTAEFAARAGDHETARRIYLDALELDDAVSRATANAGLGQLLFQQGAHEQAIPYFEEALETAELSERHRVAAADALGRCYALLGRYDEALALFERALEHASSHDAATAIRFSVLLANILIDRGNFPRAEEVLASILDTARKAIDPLARAGLYWSQSRLHATQGRPDLAATYARQALAVLETTDHTLYAAKAFVLLADLENDRGNPNEALTLVEQGYPIIAATGNRYEEALFLLQKARALAALGEPEQAGSVALGVVALFEGASTANAARGYALAANVFHQLGDTARALELYELAAEQLPASDQELLDVYSAMAELYENEGRPQDALRVLKLAVQARRSVTVAP